MADKVRICAINIYIACWSPAASSPILDSTVRSVEAFPKLLQNSKKNQKINNNRKTTKMPIVDRELVNDTPIEQIKCPDQAMGDYLLGEVQLNLNKFGDSVWMVQPFTPNPFVPNVSYHDVSSCGVI